MHVCRDEYRLLFGSPQVKRELGGAGRLARSVQPYHEYGAGRDGTAIQSADGSSKDRYELLVGEVDDLLARVDAGQKVRLQHSLPNASDEVPGHPEVDVGLQQRHAHVAQGRVYVLLGEPPPLTEAAEDIV